MQESNQIENLFSPDWGVRPSVNKRRQAFACCCRKHDVKKVEEVGVVIPAAIQLAIVVKCDIKTAPSTVQPEEKGRL